MFRIGFGQDSHPFTDDKEKKLTIGGICVLEHKAFAGNSDGDVVLHALCDAIEQAIGGNSFAQYADDMCQNGVTDSAEYVNVAMRHLAISGYEINNIGVTIECKTPKVMPIVEKMRDRIAQIVHVDPGVIGINATSGDGLSDVAKGLGVASHVVVSIIRKEPLR